MKMKPWFYRLIGAGKLKLISEADYLRVLEEAIKPESREELLKPGHGVQYMGIGYIVLGSPIEEI